MKVLLDTSVLIDILKGQPGAIEKLEELRQESTLYTSTINIYEILRGIETLPQKDRSKPINSLNSLVSNIYVLNFDLESAEAAAAIFADLRRNGTPIDEEDCLIAGVCVSNGIPSILTNDEKHFSRVKQLRVFSYNRS